ncbi:LuxR C-terminal-related transcriptional regulator [Brevundimonas sp.]|uniref:LuxR C-terminal-related transcriptional regulator n=1 Tax=Brevundimonas sp. TaxID=1871086 RepID=UPI0027318A1E|nr:LuxR C-terminal-related transcriptional regulator [Brevundimonas sp.]MDP1911985.1 LuxR C-terminal-related transcriptional regulator [Brevundimonas sp.]
MSAANGALLTRIFEGLAVGDGRAKGRPNKLIAHDLGVSVRTVEMHRLHVMEKLQTRSLVTVSRLWVDARWETSEGPLVELIYP